jgi:ATP-binding cassette, subfamily B (MDR/TAP), member 1
LQIIDRVPLLDNTAGEDVGDISGDIEFRGVSFAYPSRLDTEVLRAATLRIRAGTVAAIVGCVQYLRTLRQEIRWRRAFPNFG